MQVPVINSNLSFQSEKNEGKSFKRGRKPSYDTLTTLDDRTIAALALRRTNKSVNEKKHSKITTGLLASIPFVAGIANAIASDAPTFSRKLFAGFKASSKISIMFAAFAGVMGLNYAFAKKSNKLAESEHNHPRKTMVLLAGASIGAGLLSIKGIGKLARLASQQNVLSPVVNGIKNTAGKINNWGWVKSAGEAISKLTQKHAAAADIIKKAAPYAPIAVGGAALIHSLDHSTVRNRTFLKNYINLKETQLEAIKDQKRDVEVKNDIMMQDPKNSEEMALMDNPLNDLPDEVLDKVKILHEETSPSEDS